MDEEVEVRVLFFGKARELMECEEKKTRLPRVLPYAKLKELIFTKLFDVLDCISASCVLAVDLRYANKDEIIKLNPSSEIAVIPPLSGG
ncbi:ThiS family protein [Oesophagostomum dentatum]|uniref:ThiS family protein n=1 Tax=Oesophagostomum dentatum TaxID=61180 RepID=A0A0B1SUM6_OESDE|nr:ThiS family protein [Oesophagostomum dentatum]